MAWEIFRSILELLSGLGSLYALYQCMRHFRSVLGAGADTEVWRRLTALMAWGGIFCVALVICTWVGGWSLGVLVLAVLMAVLIVGAGLVLALLRIKSLHQRVNARSTVLRDGEMAVVRSLVRGRVRGRDESGGEVRFTAEEIQSLIGLRGHVRMLNWASARVSGDVGKGLAPLMAFWAEQGDAFVIYPDDEIVVADSSA